MAFFQWFEEFVRRRLNNKGYDSLYLDTHVGAVHYYKKQGQGKLPPVVLFHGLGSSATNYAVIFPHLKKHFRQIIAIDLPGHGFSEVPNEPLTSSKIREGVRKVLDKEVNEPHLVIGNSLGGAAAINFALEEPSKVLGLFLLSPAGAMATKEEIQGLLNRFDMQTRQDARSFLNLLYHKVPRMLPYLVAGEMVRRFQSKHMKQLKESFDPDDLFTREQLQTLEMPITFFWGQSERILPTKHLRYYQEHLPQHVSFLTPEGYGHSPHLDNPRQLSSWIIDFAERLAH